MQSIRFEEKVLVTPKCCDFFAGGITHGGLGGDGRGGDGLPRRLRGEGHVRELRGRQLAGKLYRARSRLYRSQFLQENMRWKALAEIYAMHSFAQLAQLRNLNCLSNFAQN